MPSTRKQNNIYIPQTTSNYVHPSLEIRSSKKSTGARISSSSVNTVNERIEHLRRAQAPRATPATFEALRNPVFIPALRGRRRFAGPPPPRSWLEEGDGGTRTFKYGATSDHALQRRPRRPDYFPGLKLPSQLSLLHQSMVSMAGDFDWHLEYDHLFLARLPVELKLMLLSYIACHGPQSGFSITGLRTLFYVEDADNHGDTTNEEVDRLDLGGSVGHSLSLKDLGRFWHRKVKAAAPVEVLDSWELNLSLASNLRFPALTKLSLAYPGPAATWSDLLAFSRNLGSLTHLSLAYWPAPRLSSSTAVESSSSPATAQPESFDLSEAAYLLRLFSRNTPSLQYLSLEGCSSWLRALKYDAPVPATRRKHPRQVGFDFNSETPSLAETNTGGAEWTTSWRNLTYLNLSQGWLPTNVDPVFLHKVQDTRSNPNDHDFILRIPTEPSLAPAPTLHQQPRVFPTARILPISAPDPRVSLQEGDYTITAPLSVAQSVQAALRRRKWCQRELQISHVNSWLGALRKNAGCKVCVVDRGWEAEDLIKVGYKEEDLFAAGF